MDWISIEDRLPECTDTVIVSGMDPDRYVSVGYYAAEFETWTALGDPYLPDSLFGVTHWMPLPEPPK